MTVPTRVFLVLAIAVSCRSQPPSDRITKLAVDAAAGDSLAQYNLAVELYRGDSLSRDYAKAAVLWKRAMEQGSADATNNYAYLLYNGLGVSADQAAAVALWRRAAGFGQPESHFHLGYAALNGRGTPTDTTEAVARYRAAIALAEGSGDSIDAAIADDARKAIAGIPRGANLDVARADSLTALYSSIRRRDRP